MNNAQRNAGKKLMAENNLISLMGGGATVRTIRQPNQTFMTVTYWPAGISDIPSVKRYAGDWQAIHAAAVVAANKAIGN